MNRESILNELKRLLSRFSIHPLLIGELVEILNASGKEPAFFKILLARLNLLLVVGVQVTRHKEFELIGDGIFSMHCSSQAFNIRILFAFLPDNTPCLLLAFFERGGKRATNYSQKLGPAKTRFQELLEAYKNEK